jgi:hypothetical protein
VRPRRDRIANSAPSSNQFISRLTVSKFIFRHSAIGALRAELSRLERTRRDHEAIRLRWILIKCPSIRRPSQRQESVLRIDFVRRPKSLPIVRVNVPATFQASKTLASFGRAGGMRRQFFDERTEESEVKARIERFLCVDYGGPRSLARWADDRARTIRQPPSA